MFFSLLFFCYESFPGDSTVRPIHLCIRPLHPSGLGLPLILLLMVWEVRTCMDCVGQKISNIHPPQRVFCLTPTQPPPPPPARYGNSSLVSYVPLTFLAFEPLACRRGGGGDDYFLELHSAFCILCSAKYRIQSRLFVILFPPFVCMCVCVLQVNVDSKWFFIQGTFINFGTKKIGRWSWQRWS